MSHISRIKTQMVEKEYLLQALKDTGYSCKETSQTIQLHAHNISFRKSGKTYECVADWWGIRGVNRQKFLQQVTQRYAYQAARAKLEQQGFSLVSEEVQEGNRIHLKLRRTA